MGKWKALIKLLKEYLQKPWIVTIVIGMSDYQRPFGPIGNMEEHHMFLPI
jgi:hypothetical protein